MVKYRPLKENLFREYFSYLVDPILGLSRKSDSKLPHSYKTGKPSNVASYFYRFVSDNKSRQLYRNLDYLNITSRADLEEQKSQGLISKGIHPVEEQKWFIEYLKPRIEFFTADDAWLLMLNDGQRDKYSRYLSRGESISQFEIFVQNYFFSALSAPRLVEIFLLAYEANEEEKEEKLFKFLDCLCFRQTTLLIETLRKITIDYRLWVSYCKNLLEGMRNAQVKDVIFSLPPELQEEALKKLYPYELIEVVEKMESCEQKDIIIQNVLRNGLTWWDEFPYEEVKEALSLLRAL